MDGTGKPVQGCASMYICDRRIFVLGQLYSGLGCSYGKPTGIRPVVPSANIFPHQPSGTACCVVGASPGYMPFPAIWNKLMLPSCRTTYVHSCLLAKSGGTWLQQIDNLALQVCRWVEVQLITLIPRIFRDTWMHTPIGPSRKGQILKTK